jgi:hypothetical protein
MNKAEIRAAARTITELDQNDVTDTTLDLYIKDGYDRIIALERRWPFLEAATTLSTVANQRDYPLSSIGAGNLREVISLVNPDPGARLQLISYDQGEEAFLANQFDHANEPHWWSVWGDSIQLWPKPDAVYQLLVRGYRKPNSWHLSDGVEVDADERLHRSLVYYTVAHLYQLQEDTEMASYYRNTFEEAVQLVRADIMRVPSHGPLMLSAGGPLHAGPAMRGTPTGNGRPVWWSY